MRKRTYKQYNRNLNYNTHDSVFRSNSLFTPARADSQPINATAASDDLEITDLHDHQYPVFNPRWWNHVYQEDIEPNYFQYSRESSSGEVLDTKPARFFTPSGKAPQVEYITTAQYADSDSSDEYHPEGQRPAYEELLQPAILMYCNARCVLEELSGLNVVPPGWSSSSSASPNTSRDRLGGKQQYKTNRVPSPFPNYSIPKIDLSKGWTLPTVTEVKEAQTSVSRDLLAEAKVKKLCNWLSSDAKENEAPVRMTQSAKEGRQTQPTYLATSIVALVTKSTSTQTLLTLADLDKIFPLNQKDHKNATSTQQLTARVEPASAPVAAASTNPFEADYEKRYTEVGVYRAGTELGPGCLSYLESRGSSPAVTCLPPLSLAFSRPGSALTDAPSWRRLWRWLTCCRSK